MKQSQSFVKNIWQGMKSLIPGPMTGRQSPEKFVGKAGGKNSAPKELTVSGKTADDGDRKQASLETGEKAPIDAARWTFSSPESTQQTSSPSSRSRNYTPETRTHLREETFGMAYDMSVIDRVFEEQRQTFWQLLDDVRSEKSSMNDHTAGIYREFGKADGGRRYFYVKTFNERGWLFERSGIGWVLSRAEKITERNLFVRHGSAFDLVTVLVSKDSSRVRISSQRWSLDHLNADIYAKKCFDAMGLIS